MDEPTTGLDWRGSSALLSVIEGLNATGTTVVAITHDMGLVARHARRVVVMANGRKIAEGEPYEIFARADVLEAARLRAPQAFRITSRLQHTFGRPRLTADAALADLGPSHTLAEHNVPEGL